MLSLASLLLRNTRLENWKELCRFLWASLMKVHFAQYIHNILTAEISDIRS